MICHTRRFLVAIAAAGLLVGCASRPTTRDPPDVLPALAIGYFSHGQYLPQAPCSPPDAPPGEECIYSGPPEMSLEFEVKEVLAGALRRSRVRLTTYSHWGLLSTPVGRNHMTMVLIVQGSNGLEIPTYSFSPVGKTNDGGWAIAIERPNYRIPWLPCDLQSDVERLEWRVPVRVELGRWDEADLEEAGDYAEIRGRWIYMTHGVRIDPIRDELSRRRPNLVDVWCRG